jgi:hypothetical protein
MSLEEKNYLKNLFLNELKKNIQLERLLNLFSEYLNDVEDHKVLRYLLTNHRAINQNKNIILTEENINVLIACHSVWKHTQVISDKISSSIKRCTNKLSYDIMGVITLCNVVYEIFKSKLSESAKHLIKLYEDTCILLNSPRKEFEESYEILKLRTIYYLDIYLPLNILGIELNITEIDFILYNLVKLKSKKLLEEWEVCSENKPDIVKIIKKIDHYENVIVQKLLNFVNFGIE